MRRHTKSCPPKKKTRHLQIPSNEIQQQIPNKKRLTHRNSKFKTQEIESESESERSVPGRGPIRSGAGAYLE